MAIVIDWFSKRKRAEEKLAKAKGRRDREDFAVSLAEKELEEIKRQERMVEAVR